MSDPTVTADILDHIGKVGVNLSQVIAALVNRAAVHDASKLLPPEKEMFDEYTPKLATVEYGSPEYHANTAAMGPALEHHYSVNSHHPEHFTDGVNGMTLLDVIEMVCDWHGAAQRREGGHVRGGLQHNLERYGIEPQLAAIITHTVDELWPEVDG